MGEFFKPWRRKAGVATLVMACVFAAAWVRSQTVADHIDIPQDKRLHMLNSRHGNLVYCRFEQDAFPSLPPVGIVTQFRTADPPTDAAIAASYSFTSTPPVKWTTSSAVVDKFEGIENVTLITHRGFCGIDYIVRKTPRIGDLRIGQLFVFLIVPYWSILIPLTLLSAFLLLSKPRNSALMKPIEPTAIEGV